MLPIEDREAAALLGGIPEDTRRDSWRLVLPDGRLVGYGRGLVELCAATQRTRPLARLLARIPGNVLDMLYRALAKHRDRLARFVPDGPAPRRFP